MIFFELKGRGVINDLMQNDPQGPDIVFGTVLAKTDELWRHVAESAKNGVMKFKFYIFVNCM